MPFFRAIHILRCCSDETASLLARVKGVADDDVHTWIRRSGKQGGDICELWPSVRTEASSPLEVPLGEENVRHLALNQQFCADAARR